MMSVSMTARKIVISSGMVKNCGWKMPLRATSIMPHEKVTPASMPRLAMIMITCPWRDPRPDRGVEEVDRVVADADDQVGDGEREEDDNRELEHVHLGGLIFATLVIRIRRDDSTRYQMAISTVAALIPAGH